MLATINNTLGALLIGTIASTALWGISCTQVWNYFRVKPRDSIYLKWLVAVVWVTDSIHQILVVYALYGYVIVDYGVPIEQLKVLKTVTAQVPVQEVTAIIVQSFFTYRIWKLSHGNVPLTLCIVFLVIAQFAVGIAMAVRTLSCSTFTQTDMPMHDLTLAYSASMMITDVALAMSLCWLLHSSRSEFSRTNSLINKLILSTFTTGFFTSVAALGGLIAYLVDRNCIIYMPFFFVVGRLYVNSLCASLNMRASMQSSFRTNEGSSGSYNGRNYPVFASKSRSLPHEFSVTATAGGRETQLAVQIETEKQTFDEHAGMPMEHRVFDHPYGVPIRDGSPV